MTIAGSRIPLVIIFETHDVVLAQIVAELDLDERQQLVCAVAEAMIGLWWDVYVLAFIEAQGSISADNVGSAGDDDPVLTAPRVTLQTQARSRLDLKPLDFITTALFQNFVTSPRSLIRFSHCLRTSCSITLLAPAVYRAAAQPARLSITKSFIATQDKEVGTARFV
jgi:hypothetical protein